MVIPPTGMMYNQPGGMAIANMIRIAASETKKTMTPIASLFALMLFYPLLKDRRENYPLIILLYKSAKLSKNIDFCEGL